MSDTIDETERHRHDDHDGERRHECISHKDTLNRLESLFERQVPINRRFDNFIAQAKVVGIVASFIYLGSFVYTYDHKQESNGMMILHRALIDNNTRNISSNQGDYKSLFARLDSLTLAMENSNLQTGRLLDVIIRRTSNEILDKDAVPYVGDKP